MYRLLTFDFSMMSYKSLKLFTFFGTLCSILYCFTGLMYVWQFLQFAMAFKLLDIDGSICKQPQLQTLHVKIVHVNPYHPLGSRNSPPPENTKKCPSSHQKKIFPTPLVIINGTALIYFIVIDAVFALTESLLMRCHL